MLGGLYVGGYVIDVNRFSGFGAAGAQSLPVNQRARLAGAHGTGIGPRREEAEKIIARLHVGKMNGIRVGQQSQAISFRQALEPPGFMDWLGIESEVPSFRELVEGQRTAQALAQVEIPVPRLHAAFLPVWPMRVFLDGGPKLGGGKVPARRQ